MINALDLSLAVICVLIALGFCSIHVMTSPRRKHWQNLQWWVRLPLYPAAAVFFCRGANAVGVAQADPLAAGHVTFWGLTANLMILWVTYALVGHVLSRTYPARTWERLNHVAQLASCRKPASPDETVAVAMPLSEVLRRIGGDNPWSVVPPASVPGPISGKLQGMTQGEDLR